MRILIAGVHGFIGSHLAAYVLALGHDVIGIARSPSSTGEARAERFRKKERFHIRYADLTTDISGINERIDIVFNLAARTSVDHSILDPGTFIRNNYVAASNLMEDARRNGASRFIQISTDEVYGPISEGSYSEGAALHPSNPYAATKAAADLLIDAFRTTFGFPGMIARLSNVYGPWQHPQKAIPTFIRSALSDTPLPIFGDGSHRRTWISVEDVCAALWLIAERGRVGEIYHVSGQDELTNLELGKLILRHLDRSPDLVQFISERDSRPGHDKRYALTTEKLRTMGWRPKLTMDRNLARVINWFRTHTWWLNS